LGVYLAPKVSPETDGKGGEAEAGTVLRGLLIDRIEPGTIAKALGLRRGDVLLELNGTKLESAADVSRVLRERKAEEDLRVTFTDRRGERRTLTWKPQLGAE
jgi:S1-C subfamily serine protease